MISVCYISLSDNIFPVMIQKQIFGRVLHLFIAVLKYTDYLPLKEKMPEWAGQLIPHPILTCVA